MTTERKFDSDGFATYFEDFFNFTAADWTITTTEAGAGAATEAITPGEGGVLLITNDDADNDADFFQGSESFKFVTGKKLMFKSRFKVSDATESDFVLGLQITDTTPLDVSDGIFFQKDDGDALLDCHVEKDGTASSLAGIATIADDTWMTAEAYYDGTAFDFYINGLPVGTLPVTNAPDDEELAISFGIQNGAAAAKTMSIDYIKVVQER